MQRMQKNSGDIGYDDFPGRIARHLQVIYKSDFSESTVNRILGITGRHYPAVSPWDEKDVVLITYGNSFLLPGERPLKTLHRFLSAKLNDIISCVHILPFFPCTSDDGFAVSDFSAVNPELGTWEDVTEIGKKFSLIFDLVINHVSASHSWFRGFLSGKMPWSHYFIEADPMADYSKVTRPRSTPLFTDFVTKNGKRSIWTTFSADQVDLNFSNPEVLLEMIAVLCDYIARGARIIRLDAIAFLWKEKNTTCLHLPETHEIVKLLRDIATFIRPGVIVLTETNVPNKENWSYFGNGDEAHMVYQFSLPPLLLHALFSGTSTYLTNWASEIPGTGKEQTFLNYTASHDGIGVRPLEGILPDAELRSLLAGMTGLGGRISQKRNPDGSDSPYEINITYLDAMKGTRSGIDGLQEQRFMCSQATMMAMKGIPAFYILSLLGTSNYHEGFAVTGISRSINRRRWNETEINGLLSEDTPHKRVFEALGKLILIRKQFKAFHPDSLQEILRPGDPFFAFKRYDPKSGNEIFCISNMSSGKAILRTDQLTGYTAGNDLITSGRCFSSPEEISFEPYQVRWLL